MMYITWVELAAVVVIIVCVIVCFFLVRLISNINASAKVLKEILRVNEKNINDTMANLPAISKNLVEISDTAKDQIKVVENVIQNINNTAEMTAATVNTVKDDFIGRIKGFLELFEIIKRVFLTPKDNK